MKWMMGAALLLCAAAEARADGLRWAGRDSGRDIAWEDAKAYCAGKGAGWRLPEIGELETLFGGALPAKLHLSGSWFWSATEVSPEDAHDAEDVAWGVVRANGIRTQNLRPIAYHARALCVRSPL